MNNDIEFSFTHLDVRKENSSMLSHTIPKISFTLEGPGEIIATDNGDPTDMTPFPSRSRNAFSGMALIIVRGAKDKQGTILLKAEAPGLKETEIKIQIK